MAYYDPDEGIDREFISVLRSEGGYSIGPPFETKFIEVHDPEAYIAALKRNGDFDRLVGEWWEDRAENDFVGEMMSNDD